MKDRKNIIIGGLCACICALAVAYAAFSQTLNVNATGTIDTSWGPFFVSACTCSATKAGVTTPTATCAATSGTLGSTGTVGVTITFNAYTPGDKATCTVTVTNTGTLHAAAPTFNASNSSHFTIAGSSGTCIKAKSGTTNGSGTFVATVTYNSNSTSAPTAVETATLTATYTQAASCA